MFQSYRKVIGVGFYIMTGLGPRIFCIKEIRRLRMCPLLIKQQMIKKEAACQQSEILMNFTDRRNSKPVRAEHRGACAGAVGADVKN